jgi:hypothetical protein
MQEIVKIASEYPLVAIGIALVVLVIFIPIFKKLVKIALILLLVAIAIGGYFYVQYPEKRPANFGEAIDKARNEAGRVLDKGKETIEKGKELMDKGIEVYDKGKAVLEKGVDKGKDVVNKGKGAAEEIGKKIGEEKETGKR